MFAASPRYAREVIHAFNQQGFAALDPNGAGSSAQVRPPVREEVCRVGETPPPEPPHLGDALWRPIV
jgi:hypothetical protein